MEITSSVEIDRSAADVFNVISDMSKNPTWQQGQVRCTWTSEPPLRIGSTYDQEARFLGKAIISSFGVTEYEPGAHIRIVSTAGTMDIDVTRSVTPRSDTSCTVSAIVRGSAPGPMKLLGPLLPVMVRASVNKDYKRLKSMLEEELVDGEAAA